MAEDDPIRSDWQPPAWLTARPQPLVSQGPGGAAPGASPGVAQQPVPEVPPVPGAPTVSDPLGEPPTPPPPGALRPRPTLRPRPEDRDRPAEACEIPQTRDALEESAPPAPAAVEAAASEAVTPPAEPVDPAANLADQNVGPDADPDLVARLRAWERVDQDLYRLLGYEETERLVFRDEDRKLLEAPGPDGLERRLREVKFDLSRIEPHTYKDVSLWWTSAVVALLVTGLLGMFDLFSPFWTFVVVFLVSSFGRIRRRWRRRLDKVTEDHRLTYELVGERLQSPT